VKKSLGVDSVYRSIRDLPSTLQYDYNRRVIARESSKFGDARIESILPNQVSTDLNGDLNAKEGNQVTSSNEGSSQQQQQQQFNVDVLRLLSCEMKWLQAYLNEYLQQVFNTVLWLQHIQYIIVSHCDLYFIASIVIVIGDRGGEDSTGSASRSHQES
jgi:hypothetical protein